MEDLELMPILKADEVSAHDAGSAGLAAAKLNGVQDTCDYFQEWEPEYLDKPKDQ